MAGKRSTKKKNGGKKLHQNSRKNLLIPRKNPRAKKVLKNAGKMEL